MNSGCERHPADGAPWVVGRKVSPRVAWTELPLAVVGEHSRQHGRRHRLRCHSLAATTLTSDPALIAGLSLAYSLVRILLVVPVGVVVDRVDRRLLMWASNVIRGAIFVGVSVFFAVGAGDLLLLYAAFVLVGVMEIVADNAAISVLPDVVDAGNLDRTNGRVATTQLVADEFAGPPFGGLLFAVAVWAPLAVTGGLYAVAGLFFLLMPFRFRPVDPLNVVASIDVA